MFGTPADHYDFNFLLRSPVRGCLPQAAEKEGRPYRRPTDPTACLRWSLGEGGLVGGAAGVLDFLDLGE